MEMYCVYVKTDEVGNVIAVNSNVFQHDLDGWTKIDEGAGERYFHAQGNYFPKPIRTEMGVCRYKMADGTVQERSEEEIRRQEAKMVVPSQLDMIEAQLAYTAMMTDTLLEV